MTCLVRKGPHLINTKVGRSCPLEHASKGNDRRSHVEVDTEAPLSLTGSSRACGRAERVSTPWSTHRTCYDGLFAFERAQLPPHSCMGQGLDHRGKPRRKRLQARELSHGISSASMSSLASREDLREATRSSWPCQAASTRPSRFAFSRPVDPSSISCEPTVTTMRLTAITTCRLSSCVIGHAYNLSKIITRLKMIASGKRIGRTCSGCASNWTCRVGW